jgi:hypothetical protein
MSVQCCPDQRGDLAPQNYLSLAGQAEFRNMGGFHMIGSGRDKVSFPFGAMHSDDEQLHLGLRVDDRKELSRPLPLWLQ